MLPLSPSAFMPSSFMVDYIFPFNNLSRDMSPAQFPEPRIVARRPKRPIWPNPTMTPLYKLCIYDIVKGIGSNYGDGWDLSLLPPRVRNDLYRWLMSSSTGFAKDTHYLNLLPDDVNVIRLLDTVVVTDAILSAIATRQHITEVYITEVFVLRACEVADDKLIESLSQSCKNLMQLVLERCKNITDDCAKALSTMPLRELNLSGTMTTNKLLIDLADTDLMQNHLIDISVKDCNMNNAGLCHLNWSKLLNVNLIGTRILDLSCVPSDAVYKTLNCSL